MNSFFSRTINCYVGVNARRSDVWRWLGGGGGRQAGSRQAVRRGHDGRKASLRRKSSILMAKKGVKA